MNPLLFIVVMGVCIAVEAWDRMQAADWEARARRAREKAFADHADQAVALTRPSDDFELWEKEYATR